MNTNDLEILANAASHWATELTDYIIPASEEAGDLDSVESQTAELNEIQAALGRYLEEKESRTEA